MSRFVPGLELCCDFYAEVVAPAVGVRHGAALLGPGSDVLGYDTERSTDHDWGPRCQLFVKASDLDEVRTRVLTSLPKSYGGRLLAIGRDGERLEPHVVISTLPAWLEGELGWDLGELELTAVDWLLIPQTRLLGITQGAVFADPDATSHTFVDGWPGSPTPCGGGCWPASGSVCPRRSPFSSEQPRWETKSVPLSWPADSFATACASPC